jgi:hypothetical protein
VTDRDDFAGTQKRFAAHVRDPENRPPPGDVEDRRMAIYRDLVYNNIESFLANGFPVLRRLTPGEAWHSLVRDFIIRHRAESPYFLEIGREFLHYLQEERGERPGDPPFMLELAHYEWVELMLDVSREGIPDNRVETPDLLREPVQVSPLAWSLSYRYPVHRIGVDYQPETSPAEPTYLVVYRNRQDRVRFMEANAVTARLLQLLEEEGMNGETALAAIAAELGHPDPAVLMSAGAELLEKLFNRDILYTP